MQRKKKIFLIGMIVIIVASISLFSTVKSEEKKVNGLLDLGNKYLEELNYEQALATYNAVLDLVPDNPDAYLGIVEVYIRKGEYETALEYAKKGYEVTQDIRLQEKIEMIESGNIYDSQGNSLIEQTELTSNIKFDMNLTKIWDCTVFGKNIKEWDYNSLYNFLIQNAQDITEIREDISISNDNYSAQISEKRNNIEVDYPNIYQTEGQADFVISYHWADSDIDVNQCDISILDDKLSDISSIAESGVSNPFGKYSFLGQNVENFVDSISSGLYEYLTENESYDTYSQNGENFSVISYKNESEWSGLSLNFESPEKGKSIRVNVETYKNYIRSVCFSW